MPKLLVIGVVGLFAQLIDGALGMSYGVTSTSLLLTVGVAPAVASASVHLAEIGTTLASGTAHSRFGNVDWRIVGLLAVPGFIGAFIGAVVLSSLSAEAAEPVVSGILLALGIYVLWRFLRSSDGDAPKPDRIKGVFMAPLGLIAGAMDALGGGGWGPIGTPTLLSTTDVEPRKVVGSIDTSEFVVAVGASLGFLVGLGAEAVDYSWVGALLVGGLIAAPLAAWIVKSLPPRILGLSVGVLIIVTNLQTIGDAAGINQDILSAISVAFGITWIAAMATLLVRNRRSPSGAAAPA
jgi:uncharacterized membrane protein YfcA